MTTTKKQISDIAEAWRLLSDSVDNLNWGYSDADRLLQQTLDESKRHNQGRYGPRHLSIQREAQYFAVKRVVECLQGYTPKLSEFWHLQQSIFGAYALVHNSTTAPLIAKVYGDNRELFNRVVSYDYAEMMSDSEVQHA